MDAQQLAEKYRQGALTDQELAVESLVLLEPDNPGPALCNLPDHVLDKVLEFATTYRPGQMLSTDPQGRIPSQEQVQMASDWIRKSRHCQIKSA